MLVKQYEGQGEILDDLEWDVKSYLTLGGAMHDAAVTAWGIKGYYDYIRPISAIRYMADKGQSSFPDSVNYHPDGITLIDGYIELVTPDDTMNGFFVADTNKIKLYAWRGPDYIDDPETDAAGVGWILAENWWPYQRPTFVTPNFAGYVSGHSTYSRAAAEVMTRFTGDKFFPGGMGTFLAKKDEFLVFEEGPSQDIELQYATYYDASDQTSLSRIWGGIHPPADDMPGRLIGMEIGNDAFDKARSYFKSNTSSVTNIIAEDILIYPNPIIGGSSFILQIPKSSDQAMIQVIDLSGRILLSRNLQNPTEGQKLAFDINSIPSGTYVVRIQGEDYVGNGKLVIME
ncbi:MAG: T9SS type A sorting domain-containing protein [Saprospiraceae bacterium]|nr:T9SS type A sorting domain-containing protein [Saprospiraceae bacterium]